MEKREKRQALITVDENVPEVVMKGQWSRRDVTLARRSLWVGFKRNLIKNKLSRKKEERESHERFD